MTRPISLAMFSPQRSNSPWAAVVILFLIVPARSSHGHGDAFADEVLEAHNRYRAKHGAPPLSLDQSLNELAQEWAEHLLEIGHMEHRQPNEYGENVFYKWTSDPSYSPNGNEPVDSWYSEIKAYTFGSEPGNLGQVGHFTQLVWRSSKRLGVGMASADGTVFVVCNYDPAGNFRGRYAHEVQRPGAGQASEMEHLTDDTQHESENPDGYADESGSHGEGEHEEGGSSELDFLDFGALFGSLGLGGFGSFGSFGPFQPLKSASFGSQSASEPMTFGESAPGRVSKFSFSISTPQGSAAKPGQGAFAKPGQGAFAKPDRKPVADPWSGSQKSEMKKPAPVPLPSIPSFQRLPSQSTAGSKFQLQPMPSQRMFQSQIQPDLFGPGPGRAGSFQFGSRPFGAMQSQASPGRFRSSSFSSSPFF